mgnify:CR=1 FL=1
MYLKSPEKHVHTHIPQNVTTPLHPVLPADIAEIPTAQTVMKHFSYGYTISAYGHDYDNGVITTEPTTETDGIITYTCKRCKHQDTKNLGKLGDGEPYIEGSFQKKSWDTVNDLIKTSKEKDTISIIMNGARTLPASVLSGIKEKIFP